MHSMVCDTGRVVHHWRPSDLLEQSFVPGQWFMYDRGRMLGVIELGRINGQWGFRGRPPDDDRVLGYAWTLEEACDRLWEWHLRCGPLVRSRR